MRKTVIYKTAEEIELIRESALLVSKTLAMVATEIRPGITPKALDKLAEAFIRDHDALPGFMQVPSYDYTLCTSVNEQVVHGLPTDRPLENGDIIAVDCGVYKNGFYGDHAYTFAVGEIASDVRQLLDVTKESLNKAIEASRVGNRIGDIGHAVQTYAESFDYGVVRELVGHGLGRGLHEEPQIPNYGRAGTGKKIQNGLVIAIEPMINMGTRRVRTLRDGWTIVTADGKPSAHFEHNIAIIDGKPEVLSTFEWVEEALAKKASV